MFLLNRYYYMLLRGELPGCWPEMDAEECLLMKVCELLKTVMKERMAGWDFIKKFSRINGHFMFVTFLN